jgi:nucleoside-diphosphate-sugar epimerase
MSNGRQVIKNWFNGSLSVQVATQAKKPRYGNRFIVIGADGYLGWPTICQLAYKFPGSEIFCIDRTFQYRKQLDELTRMFGSKVEFIKSNYSNYFSRTLKPDVIINVANQNLDIETKKKSHLITLNDYDGDHKHPVTVLKTPTVIGNWNMTTIRSKSLKLKKKSLVDEIISNVLTGEEQEDKLFSVISLEDFTRSIIKVCRKTNPPLNEQYQLFDRYITRYEIAEMIAKYLRRYKRIATLNFKNRVTKNSKRQDKSKFIDLIDKHRPVLEVVITYSCRGVLNEK